MSKISKAVDQTPSSVTSTPRTPRIDLASRLAGKNKKEKKEREKGLSPETVEPTLTTVCHRRVCAVFAAHRKKSSVASLDPDGLNVEVGDQVLVAGQKNGIVRFYGKTDFAPGGSAARRLFLPTFSHVQTLIFSLFD